MSPVAPQAGGTTGDMFLKVKGAKMGDIKGESQADGHKDEIDVLGWSWGMQAKSSLGGGVPTGKATVNELRVTKRIDSSSTALMIALRTNDVISKAVLTLRKAGKTQLDYFVITIEQGRVVSLSVEGGGGSGGTADVVEKVAFAFNKIDVTYKQQGSDGQLKGGMSFADQWSDNA